MKKFLVALIAVMVCVAICSSAMAQGHRPGPPPHHGYRPAPPPAYHHRPVPPPPRYYRPLPPPPRPLPPPPPRPVVVPLPAPAPLYTPGYYYPRSGIYLNTPNVGISIGL